MCVCNVCVSNVCVNVCVCVTCVCASICIFLSIIMHLLENIAEMLIAFKLESKCQKNFGGILPLPVSEVTSRI